MITNGKCTQDTLKMANRLKNDTSLPVSVLTSPTILKTEDLHAMKKTGVDKIGVAIDLATPELFDKYRGNGVSGPHKWEKYWEIMKAGLEVFGHSNVGIHLMVGMGETEEELVSLMDRSWRMGIVNHMFSFFAEEGSKLAHRPQPPWPAYLRVQLARYLIEEGLSTLSAMNFDPQGSIVDFGLDSARLHEIICLGKSFMTTGCAGPDGHVDCNRPFGNCLPDVKQWNYPYLPNEEEIDQIGKNIWKIG